MELTYEQWEHQVDIELEKLCGVGIDFMPDWNSRDAYDADMPPKLAAKLWFGYSKAF